YNNAAGDGTDVGVDQDALEHATAGSINGIWFAYKVGSTMYVKFGDEQLPIALTPGIGSSITASKWVTSLNLSGVTAISVTGSPLDDLLQIHAPITLPMSFVDSAGEDTLEILSGTQNFAADIGTPSRNLGIDIDGGAGATFAATQHLASLNIDASGVASIASGGANKPLVTSALTIAAGGKLDLGDG